jgi:formate-dependent nitrite reductase membrane component NrfD
VPLYLFVGGLAGASAVVALASRVVAARASSFAIDVTSTEPSVTLGLGSLNAVTTEALAISVLGALVSAVLLVSDLGRPSRFLNMLRVFKWRSPMSVGVWLLSAFGASAGAALVLDRALGESALRVAAFREVLANTVPLSAFTLPVLLWLLLGATAVLGALVATYTGVLLAVTAVPAWNAHRALLPVHFGTAALGSAAALLELRGHALEGLAVLVTGAAAIETILLVVMETHRLGARDRALREGTPGLLVRGSNLLTGPIALGLRLAGFRLVADGFFLVGALFSRFGWIHAGRASAVDPEAAL